MSARRTDVAENQDKSLSSSSTSSVEIFKSINQKKLPPSKAPVGLSPPPQIKNVKAKVGSLDNINYKSKIGDRKTSDKNRIPQTSLSKSNSGRDSNQNFNGSLKENVSGSSKFSTEKDKTVSQSKTSIRKAEPKNTKRFTSSKIGSRNSIKPKQKSIAKSEVSSKVGSMVNIDHQSDGGTKEIISEKLDFKEKAQSKIGSLENIDHQPGGGAKKIFSEKLNFKEKAKSKVGSLKNVDHQPGGGAKPIFSEKLNFKEKAQSKVGSLDNINHVPGGGNVKIIDEKYYYSKKSRSKTEI